MDGNIGRMISFNGKNWATWKIKMEDLLYCRDLHGPIEMKTKPADMSENDWTTINRKAVGLIRQWIDDTVFHHVSTETLASALLEQIGGSL